MWGRGAESNQLVEGHLTVSSAGISISSLGVSGLNEP